MRTRLDELLIKVFGPKEKRIHEWTPYDCRYRNGKIIFVYSLRINPDGWAICDFERKPLGSTTKQAQKKDQQLEKGILRIYSWNRPVLSLFNRIP